MSGSSGFRTEITVGDVGLVEVDDLELEVTLDLEALWLSGDELSLDESARRL